MLPTPHTDHTGAPQVQPACPPLAWVQRPLCYALTSQATGPQQVASPPGPAWPGLLSQSSSRVPGQAWGSDLSPGSCWDSNPTLPHAPHAPHTPQSPPHPPKPVHLPSTSHRCLVPVPPWVSLCLCPCLAQPLAAYTSRAQQLAALAPPPHLASEHLCLLGIWRNDLCLTRGSCMGQGRFLPARPAPPPTGPWMQ